MAKAHQYYNEDFIRSCSESTDMAASPEDIILLEEELSQSMNDEDDDIAFESLKQRHLTLN